ncbi:GTP pyrophosphokinase rsh [compost metagenome]
MTITAVYVFAKEAHGEQLYGERPYLYHLACVHAKVLNLYDRDSDLESIAYLHDTLEDTDTTYGNLCHLFGTKIADAVLALTKIKGESYEEYITKVKSDHLTLKVKIAGTLCNLEESVKISDIKRIKKYTKQLELLMEE